MPKENLRYARVLDIDPDGKSVEIEFVEQHGELVIGEYMMIGPGGAPATEETKVEDDAANRPHPPPPPLRPSPQRPEAASIGVATSAARNEGIDMPSSHPRKARVLDIDPDGKSVEIEFVEQHGELVVADYVLTGPSEATVAEQAGDEIDPTPGRHLPPPQGPEAIPLPHRNPRNARVLRIDPDGKTAKIEFFDPHGERSIGTYARAGWGWAPAPIRARAQEVLDRPPIVIYGRHPKDPRWRQ